MAIKQLIKLHWANDHKSYLKFFDKVQNKTEFVAASGYIRIIRMDVKSCVGYYNLHEMTEYPCFNHTNLTDSKYIRCKKCEDLTGFSLCMMCKGDICRTNNKYALEFCKRKHVLYLAFFPNNTVKVGTAEYERRYERLLEQGAVYSIFIAEADGMNIRKIESAISKLGITPQVTPAQKLKTILDYPSTQKAKDILIEKLSFIRGNLPLEYSNYFIEVEFNNFEYLLSNLSAIPKPQPQYDLFGEIIALNSTNVQPYSIIKNANALNGEIIATIGSSILLKSNEGFVAFNLKDFFGWYIDFEIK